MPAPDLSVVAPARNEEANVGPLVGEIIAVLEPGGRTFEIVIVDDGSTDGTAARLSALAHADARVRPVRLGPAGCGRGQSAAFHAGLRAARGGLMVLLDADGQNDPADIPRLVDLLERTPADLVQGDRSAARRDPAARRIASWIGRAARRLLLADAIRDTGCSLRVMRREVGLALPLEFHGMHRFVPALARDLGFEVIEAPVSHRARTSGCSKYGPWSRGAAGLIDLLAVRWMRRRRRPTSWAPLWQGAVGADACPGCWSGHARP